MGGPSRACLAAPPATPSAPGSEWIRRFPDAPATVAPVLSLYRAEAGQRAAPGGGPFMAGGGELFDRIVARGHYTERAAAVVTKTIVEVVQTCHKHGVMHRDLKPENFLFANKKETAALKAIDFGLSVFSTPGERFTEIVGSPYYMAPEVLKRNYGQQVEVWSAGVILYIYLCGVPPFWAETEQGVAQAIIRSAIDFKRDPWPRVSDNAKDLVRGMLNPDPRRRLTAQQVLGENCARGGSR